jgi:hypothetical protein
MGLTINRLLISRPTGRPTVAGRAGAPTGRPTVAGRAGAPAGRPTVAGRAGAPTGRPVRWQAVRSAPGQAGEVAGGTIRPRAGR